jgi:molybdopterin synthase catalytic subunit
MAECEARHMNELSDELDDAWIELLADALPIAEAIEFVADVRAGGIDVFLGTTRSDLSPDGRPLHALDYEAYGPMALARMQLLGRMAREKYPVMKLAILHRTGRVALAEPSVLIAVATPHRAQAFEACRWIIDRLKVDVPIWKKEIWSDGGGSWVHPAPAALSQASPPVVETPPAAPSPVTPSAAPPGNA